MARRTAVLHVGLLLLCLSAIAADPPQAKGTRIVSVDGIPTLLVDGTPTAPLIYRENLPANYLDEGIEHYANFSKTGVNIFLCGGGLGVSQTKENRIQGWLRHVDPTIERVLKATGDTSRVLLIINTVVDNRGNKAWCEKHPSEMMVWPPAMARGSRVSLSSRPYREAIKEALAQFVEHVNSASYRDRILGYFLCGGEGEWLDYWDYSEPARLAFAAFARKKYGDDLAALRRAWNMPGVTWESIALPAWDRFSKADVGLFYDPRKSRHIVDYFECYHDDLAGAASEFAAVVKGALSAPRIVGIWNGYYFFPGWSPPEQGIFRRRQGAFARLLDDPNIDFFVAPYGYRERHPGGVFLRQFLSDSIRLHGKLSITEDDTRTFLAPEKDEAYSPAHSTKAHVTVGDSFGSCADLPETIAVLKRNFAGVITKPGSGIWWYPLGSRGGWYENPELMKTLSGMSQISKELLGKDRAASQIAVIVSNRSFWFQRFNRLPDDQLTRQMTENLLRLGAPLDIYLDTDLCHSAFPFDRYRMFIFLNTFFLSPDERRIVKGKVSSNGRTVLWIYAPGLVTDDGISADHVADLTGIRLRMTPVEFQNGLEVALTDLDHALTRGLAANTLRHAQRDRADPVGGRPGGHDPGRGGRHRQQRRGVHVPQAVWVVREEARGPHVHLVGRAQPAVGPAAEHRPRGWRPHLRRRGRRCVCERPPSCCSRAPGGPTNAAPAPAGHGHRSIREYDDCGAGIGVPGRHAAPLDAPLHAEGGLTGRDARVAPGGSGVSYDHNS